MNMQWVYIDMILKNDDNYKTIPVAPLLTLVTTILFLAHDVQRKLVVVEGQAAQHQVRSVESHTSHKCTQVSTSLHESTQVIKLSFCMQQL